MGSVTVPPQGPPGPSGDSVTSTTRERTLWEGGRSMSFKGEVEVLVQGRRGTLPEKTGVLTWSTGMYNDRNPWGVSLVTGVPQG